MSGVQSNGVGYWEHCKVSGPYPDNMVPAGFDTDGEVIYVGRAFHLGNMLPAKVIPSTKKSYVGFNGKEIKKEDFEVLCNGEYVWELASNGSVPHTAMKIGATVDGEPLYMGRAIYRGSQTPGKVQQSHRCCFLPFDGADISVNEYEVLCTN